jgi:hypothetical protein
VRQGRGDRRLSGKTGIAPPNGWPLSANTALWTFDDSWRCQLLLFPAASPRPPVPSSLSPISTDGIRHAGIIYKGSARWSQSHQGVKSTLKRWDDDEKIPSRDSGEIIAHHLSEQETGDALQLEPLLDQIDEEICQIIADEAYDGYQPITLSCITAQTQGSSFRRDRTRLNCRAPKPAARGTTTLPPC